MINVFKKVAYSPETRLTTTISGGATTIAVGDITAFPPAPNRAVINNSDGTIAETIFYREVSGNQLQNVSRAIEDTDVARTWLEGSIISAPYTAHEHNALVEGLNNHTHPATQNPEENPNLDNYTNEGTYFFERDIVGTVLGTPPSSVSGWLVVTKGLTTHDGSVLISQKWQRATLSASAAAETWTRFRHQATGRWSPWLPIAMFPWALGSSLGIHQSGRTLLQFGTVSLAGGANVIRTQVVNFDVGVPFGATPTIQFSFVGQDPRSAVFSSTDHTATSFRVSAVGTNGAAVTLRWLAIGATTPTMT